MSNDESYFRVVFNGNTTGEYDLTTTKVRFGRLLRLSEDKVNRAFASTEVIIKDRVTEAVAMHYAIRLTEAGCECYIEEVAADTPGPDFEERRVRNRRTTFSRNNRPELTGHERRASHGRRQSDQPRHASR
ncbi:MAG: hypothetical protein WD002_00640 [Pseudomonadales bacterium]